MREEDAKKFFQHELGTVVGPYSKVTDVFTILQMMPPHYKKYKQRDTTRRVSLGGYIAAIFRTSARCASVVTRVSMYETCSECIGI